MLATKNPVRLSQQKVYNQDGKIVSEFATKNHKSENSLLKKTRQACLHQKQN